MSLNERVIQKEFTEEFINHGCDFPESEATDRLETEARRFERTYSAVAEVGHTDSRYGGKVWTLRVIPTRDAHRDEIMRGIQSIQHYMMNPPEGDE